LFPSTTKKTVQTLDQINVPCFFQRIVRKRNYIVTKKLPK